MLKVKSGGDRAATYTNVCLAPDSSVSVPGEKLPIELRQSSSQNW